ncbi:ribosomal protein L7/L12 [Nocardioides cavernae]|uniref:Ribosomal protein L7/L12 n=1 Tax=Nocardioides cavernae TaxID=1921566 RepID=A0A7Y9GZM7_9ACTN|nr:ribosomal protein L7/L12 [Nocardioides cavernae]NYE35256.1 ribosomal protein L7/L12 [Nocardioides cavernae]
MGFFSKPEVIGPDGDDSARARLAALEQRVARLEGQLAQLAATPAGAVAAAAADVATDGWMGEVRELRRSGKTIQAIKVYRERTGVGLKEAKDAVEAMPL